MLRYWTAYAVGVGVMKDQQGIRDFWFIPLRDFAALAIRIASFFGDTVEWRGLKFKLRDGKLESCD